MVELGLDGRAAGRRSVMPLDDEIVAFDRRSDAAGVKTPRDRRQPVALLDAQQIGRASCRERV